MCGCVDGVREALCQQSPGGLLQGPVPAGAQQEYRCGERHQSVLSLLLLAAIRASHSAATQAREAQVQVPHGIMQE